MKLSTYVCGLLISSILIGPSMVFADDYIRLDKIYPSEDKIIFVENDKYGVKDKYFFTIVEPAFEDIGLYENGYAVSTFKGKKGILDSKGNVFIVNKFDDIIPLENNNFLALNKNLGSLNYIFINASKEEFLIDSNIKSYSNGGKISQEIVGSLSDFPDKRPSEPSKLDDVYAMNKLLSNTEYYIVDDVKNEDFGILKNIDRPELKDNGFYKLYYSTNLSPVIEINSWGRTLKEDTHKNIITIENLTLESLRYFTGDSKIAESIFHDIDFFMKSNMLGVKQNKNYNRFSIYYESTNRNGIKVTIRK